MLNNNIKEELENKVKKEVDEKCNEYLKMYSSGYSIEELEKERYVSNEERMVIRCELDVLESEIKEPKKSNYFLLFSIIIFNTILSLLFKNNLLLLFSTVCNLIITISSFKKIKLYKRLRVQRDEIFKLQKESLYLRIKIAVIEKIIMEQL